MTRAQRGFIFRAVFGAIWFVGSFSSGAHAEEEAQVASTPMEGGRWSVDRANAWYGQLGWIAGANFVPSTASNQLEMWQAETFDPETVDRELGWASGIGFNVMRVFLHDLAWKAAPAGFEDRMERYLEIANKHGIRTLFVLFDSCWDPRPKTGPQAAPVPGVHNSRWVQSPHIEIQQAPARYAEVKAYLAAVLTRFRNDTRVLGWDLLNEPGNLSSNYGEGWTKAEKASAHLIFLDQLFTWARAINPSQPLTAGLWEDVGNPTSPLSALDRLMLERSDIVTFHTYGTLDMAKRAVCCLKQTGRPVICTEYMSRGSGCTFEAILPYFKEQNVGAMNWGLVSGRSQTIYPWDSWQKKYVSEPTPWFHDVFRKDGSPYDEQEAALIRSLTGVVH